MDFLKTGEDFMDTQGSMNVAVAIGSQTVEKVTGFISRLLGGALDQYGIKFEDSARLKVFENQIRIVDDARRMVEKAGLPVNTVPLRTLAPLLNGAAYEDNVDLQQKWSALLANAGTDSALVDVTPSFCEILKQMSSRDAIFLDAVYEAIVKRHPPFWTLSAVMVEQILVEVDALGHVYGASVEPEFPWDVTIREAELIDNEVLEDRSLRFAVSLRNLLRLGLLWHAQAFDMDDLQNMFNGHARTSTDFTQHRYGLSALGFQFVRACRPPSALKDELANT